MATEDNNFEAPLVQLRRRIEELEGYPEGSGHEAELERLRRALEKTTKEVFAKLTPWQKALVARHFERPYTLDYVEHLMEDWVEIHGDRGFANDRPSSPAWPHFAAVRWWWWDTRKAEEPKRGSGATSDSHARRATARPCV